MMLMTALTLSFAACTEEPKTDGPDDKPTPPTPTESDFEITVGEVTHSVVNFTITPADLEAEYLCVLYDAETVEEFTRDEFLVQTLYQELSTEARSKGMTFEEYMPEIVDKGVLTDKYERLAPETEYYIVVFGVDPAKKYEASTAVNKTKVTTLAAPKIEISFEINTTVDGNSAEYEVIPSDENVIWYFYTLPKSTYDAYTDPAGQYQMDDTDFILLCLSKQIEALRGAGYTDNQILNNIFHKGALTLQAKDLTANTEYINLVAAFDITEAGEISIISDVTTSTYTSGDVIQKELSFEISVTDVEAMRAAIKITPSNDTDTFCWMVGAWDGVQTAEEVMNTIVAQNEAWLNFGAMIYTGVQDYTGGPGSAFKYRLDAADTDYYVIAFGYAGGVTTEPEMVTFKTLPAPAAEDTTFQMTASNITPYGFSMTVTPSESTTYWTLDVCLPEDFNEDAIIEAFNTGMDEMIAFYKEQDPNITIAQLLGTSFYRGTYSDIAAGGMSPETTYTGYVIAINPDTAHVAKLHKFDNLATTLAVGSVTPSIELVGYYSGNEENGAIFGNADATNGKAITVVKYTGFDGARSLFSCMLGDDITNTANYPDTVIWNDAMQYWQKASLTQPYSFYVADWDYVQTALAYAVDNNGLPGGIGRLYTMPTAENKGDIEELRTLVNELNAAAGKQSFALPQSVVIEEGIHIRHQDVCTEVVEVKPVAQPQAEAEVKAMGLNPTQVIVGGTYVRPFYLSK